MIPWFVILLLKRINCIIILKINVFNNNYCTCDKNLKILLVFTRSHTILKVCFVNKKSITCLTPTCSVSQNTSQSLAVSLWYAFPQTWCQQFTTILTIHTAYKALNRSYKLRFMTTPVARVKWLYIAGGRKWQLVMWSHDSLVGRCNEVYY